MAALSLLLESCVGAGGGRSDDVGFIGPVTIEYCDPYVPPRNADNDILVVVPELNAGGEYSKYAGPEYPINLPVFADLRPQGEAPIEVFVREYGSTKLTLIGEVEDRLAYELILGEPKNGQANVHLAARPANGKPKRSSVEVQELRGTLQNKISFHPGPGDDVARMEIIHVSAANPNSGWRYTLYLRRKI